MAVINGEKVDIKGISLYDYLIQEGFQPDRVVVERNLEIIPKDHLNNVMIEEEDTIEVLRFVGGG